MQITTKESSCTKLTACNTAQEYDRCFNLKINIPPTTATSGPMPTKQVTPKSHENY